MVGEWGGEGADSLIMEAAAAACLSPIPNAADSCHHDLHDVITCSIRPLIWTTMGRGGIHTDLVEEDLPARRSYKIKDPSTSQKTAMNWIQFGGKDKKTTTKKQQLIVATEQDLISKKITIHLLSSRIKNKESLPLWRFYNLNWVGCSKTLGLRFTRVMHAIIKKKKGNKQDQNNEMGREIWKGVQKAIQFSCLNLVESNLYCKLLIL